jgi:hypothetical protein
MESFGPYRLLKPHRPAGVGVSCDVGEQKAHLRRCSLILRHRDDSMYASLLRISSQESAAQSHPFGAVPGFGRLVS